MKPDPIDLDAERRKRKPAKGTVAVRIVLGEQPSKPGEIVIRADDPKGRKR